MFYIVYGVPRAGKSTTRKLMEKAGISGLDTDDLISIFQDSFPEEGIKFGNASGLNRERLVPVINALIKQKLENHEDFLLEGDSFSWEHLSTLNNDKNIKICCIGMKEIMPIEKLALIREKAKPGEWTFMHTDEELIEILEKYKCKSIEMENKCTESGIRYFDTSSNFDEVVKEVVEYLLKK